MIAESFKPRPVTSPVARPVVFQLRSLVDLQLATVAGFLRPLLGEVKGKLLDVGAGESPWRDWLPPQAKYTGLDVHSAESFGMAPRPDIVYFDGGAFPFSDESFDALLCVEVLEHVPDSAGFLAEMHRVAKPGARLFLTVPWSARCHHIPNDYYRFTRDGLIGLLKAAGFEVQRIAERGNDISAIANKLVVLTIRLLRPTSLLAALVGLPSALACGSVAVAFLAAYHVMARCGYQGGREDPLGYAVVAIRAGRQQDGAIGG